VPRMGKWTGMAPADPADHPEVARMLAVTIS
jgi:hypothetical protein